MAKIVRQSYQSTKVICLVLIAAFMFTAVILSMGNYSSGVGKNWQINKKINGLLMLIEFERIEGILQWEKELDRRNLTALVKVQDNVLEGNPEIFRRLAAKGYEIAGGYDEAPMWNMSYEQQYQLLKDSKKRVETITGQPMRVFGGRYFSYDENTLKVADALGVEYILGRGTRDVEAVIYQPREYQVKVISVTNVDVGSEMGRGSLCDYSLWARGSGPDEFGVMVDESIDKNPANMILVSHSYLGGTRIKWWREYEKALGSSKMNWRSFEDWLTEQSVINLPNAEIPVNQEVKYTSPSPEMAMDEYEPISEVEDLEGRITTGDELLCQ
ncbi:MAG TPA: polysaccharide deacetylase family protein [Candidatus Moranbacteria bacterium]|nr:polysaccharide deacetylase family protein [Candidatus Moranbacteria bacterium]